ncbi:hypothetical protein BDY19DRAFT_685202 [Irpex rosettiformis]|uniref:Uncharacterized protein n=1 Tax=Irpex rosettiformis TaxID=378272 RepID=A0ACB8UAC0_9APHY|nr:hypothetical protein BDY19DRAFT_685202 [Irpex rosettiformis]
MRYTQPTEQNSAFFILSDDATAPPPPDQPGMIGETLDSGPYQLGLPENIGRHEASARFDDSADYWSDPLNDLFDGSSSQACATDSFTELPAHLQLCREIPSEEVIHGGPETAVYDDYPADPMTGLLRECYQYDSVHGGLQVPPHITLSSGVHVRPNAADADPSGINGCVRPSRIEHGVPWGAQAETSVSPANLFNTVGYYHNGYSELAQGRSITLPGTSHDVWLELANCLLNPGTVPLSSSVSYPASVSTKQVTEPGSEFTVSGYRGHPTVRSGSVEASSATEPVLGSPQLPSSFAGPTTTADGQTVRIRCSESPDCRKTFRGSHERERHIKLVHKKKRVGPCLKCHRTFARDDSFIRHLRGPKNVQCVEFYNNLVLGYGKYCDVGSCSWWNIAKKFVGSG